MLVVVVLGGLEWGVWFDLGNRFAMGVCWAVGCTGGKVEHRMAFFVGMVVGGVGGGWVGGLLFFVGIGVSFGSVVGGWWRTLGAGG